MELLREPYLTIEYEDSSGCTSMVWGPSPSSDEYKLGNEKVLEAMAISPEPLLLVDLKDLNIMMSLSDQVWTAKDWLPKVLAFPIKKMAIVIPDSFISQIAVKSIYGALPQTDLELGFFNEHQEAKSWLTNVVQSAETW